jgi:hypothetical protein
MKYDYLVENQEGDRFTLVPRDDPEHSLDRAVRSQKMRNILSTLGLEQGFLSQYMAQLADTGTVSKDLLIEEGSAIEEELDVVYELIKRIEYDENGFDNDVTMMGENLPEEEVTWWALKSWYGVNILDRNGYTELGLDQFNIKQPITPAGSFVWPAKLDYPLSGAIEAVENARLNTEELTCFVDQHAITYDESGKPTHVDDTRHFTVGTIDSYAEFKPHATVLKPYGDEEDLS